MTYKKTQAALELLTTYGWAFLVIILMIGTLAYFGILGPSKILPSRCNFGTEFQCIDYQIVQTGVAPNPQVRLKLKNGIGAPVDVLDFNMTKDDSTWISCTGNITILSWPSGAVKDLGWTSCASTGWVAGDKAKVLIKLRYNTVASGSSYGRDVKGEIYTTVI